MTKSSKTLKVQKGSTTYTCDLYTTTAEAKVYGASSYLPVNSGGTNLYAPLYPATGWTQGFYDNYGTPLHVSKGGSNYVLAKKSLIQLGITAVAHQTITVTTSNNSIYSSASWSSGNRFFTYGTTWSASISADTGWTAGTLKNGSTNITAGTTYTLTNANVTVTATAATHKTFTLTIPATTHQTIRVYYKNYNGTTMPTNYSYKDSTSSSQTLTLGHNSEYYSVIQTTDTGWNHGTITSAGTSGSPKTLTANASISVSAASLKEFTLTLAAQTNQTIKIKYRNRNTANTGYGDWSSEITSGSSAKTYTLRYNSQVQVTSHTASTGYTKGTLKVGGSNASTGTNYTITANTTVTSTAATINSYYLRYDSKSLVVKKNNSSGATISSGSQVNYNQKVYVAYNSNWDGITYKLYENSSASGTVWLRKEDVDNFTFNMPTSQIYIQVTAYMEGGGGG